LMQFPELANNSLITLTTDDDNDNMTVEVELEELFTDDYQRLQGLQQRIQRALKDEILLTPHVKLVPKGTLPVSEGKAVRVSDKRKVYQ
ncbi:MAG: phenylacetate--CoA ligase, partial [Bacteroidaceae bacterium]|nr:phenylacetate--CoA ligase [Bacteroidaceae bacterium]